MRAVREMRKGRCFSGSGAAVSASRALSRIFSPERRKKPSVIFVFCCRGKASKNAPSGRSSREREKWLRTFSKVRQWVAPSGRPARGKKRRITAGFFTIYEELKTLLEKA